MEMSAVLYGNERSVMLGRDMVLSPAIVKDKRLDYVALGHIHKHQNLNPDGHHPVIYPGSIERVDFGEINDEKIFISAQLEKGNTTTFQAIPLQGRKFISKTVTVSDADQVQEQIMRALPDSNDMADAIFRLILTYPRDWEPMIDAEAIRNACETAFEFHFVRRPISESRLRLPGDGLVGKMTHAQLLEKYWETVNTEPDEIKVLNDIAGEIIRAVEIGLDETKLAEEELQ